MGCVLVPKHAATAGAPGGVLCTTNSSLFGAHRSDCHAEANAVAVSAQRGQSLRGSTCYVTRAPCVACYKLLATAGVGRIVAPQEMPSADCIASAHALGIEMGVLGDSDARAAWREAPREEAACTLLVAAWDARGRKYGARHWRAQRWRAKWWVQRLVQCRRRARPRSSDGGAAWAGRGK